MPTARCPLRRRRRALQKQTAAEARLKSAGCMSCHTTTDSLTMHTSPGVTLGCADCHGGNAAAFLSPGTPADSPEYRRVLDAAHVQPRFPEAWNYPSSAKPPRTYTMLNKESPEFIRFINPSDYRVARDACGACHMKEIAATERSLMATTAMFWGAAAYNNGILPFKHTILGEAYTKNGEPATIIDPQVPNPAAAKLHGIEPKLVPLPSREVFPSSDVFRVFERGGRTIITQFPEIGNPNSTGEEQKLDEPGRPDLKQSNRGPATGLRVSIPILNLTKTRLNDPDMWFMGSNDNPGDYRTSGCAGCACRLRQ